MQVNRTLTSLDLSLNLLGNEGVGVVADALKVTAWAAWVDSVQVNVALASLDISGNRFADNGTAVIFNSLKVSAGWLVRRE